MGKDRDCCVAELFEEVFVGMGCDIYPCFMDEDITEDDSHIETKSLPDEIMNRIESGEIIEQKVWRFIRELNSFSEERLDSPAIIDGRKEYTYRQMFRRWERYAKVFSALGMTGKDNSRVLLRGTLAAETVFALFALNMTGASVSLNHEFDSNNIAQFRAMSENENITDVILPDSSLDERFLRRLIKEKEDLGIRNVIVMHIPIMGEFAWPWEEIERLQIYKRFKKIKGVLFMDSLLKKYKDYQVYYDEKGRDDAMIAHTSGTTTGASKPVPMSDRGINETSARLLTDSRFETLKVRASTLLLFDLGSAYSLCDGLMLPLAFRRQGRHTSVKRSGDAKPGYTQGSDILPCKCFLRRSYSNGDPYETSCTA